MVITSSEGTTPSAFDVTGYRHALGHFATGVTVVTYQHEETGEYRGITVNSFTSVSLDPPLILVSLGEKTRSAQSLGPGRPFTVNVLHDGQLDLATLFAARDYQGAAIDWEVRGGVPELAGSSAYFHCVTRDVHEAGDHVLFVAHVQGFQAHGRSPLLFYRGSFERLHGLPHQVTEPYFDFPELW